MYRIDPDDLRLVKEFKANVYGPYSHECLRMLNRLRAGPVVGRYVLVTKQKFREWVIGRLPGKRGVPIETEDRIYTSKRDAEWEIFKRRWQAATGRRLTDEMVDDA